MSSTWGWWRLGADSFSDSTRASTRLPSINQPVAALAWWGSGQARSVMGSSAGLLQRREHFRIAHIHPTALNFQTGELVFRGNQRVDGVGEFVFAARGFLQLA